MEAHWNLHLLVGIILALGSLFAHGWLSLMAMRLPHRVCQNYRQLATQILADMPESEPTCRASQCPLSQSGLGWIWSSFRRPQRSFCRHCQAALPRAYTHSLAFVLLSVLLAFYYLPLEQALPATLIGWCLLVVAWIDFEHQIIPDSLSLPLLWSGLIANTFYLFCTPSEAILGAALGYSALWLLLQAFQLLTGRLALGHGDLKLMAAAGAWMGWLPLGSILFSAAVLGLLYACYLFLKQRFEPNHCIAFGPWIGLAFWLHLLLHNP